MRAGELLRLLLAHPQVEVGAVNGQRQCGNTPRPASSTTNSIGRSACLRTSPEALADRVVFLALPHGVSGEVAAQLHPDTLVIDCGADFRLTEATVWVLPVGSPAPGRRVA